MVIIVPVHVVELHYFYAHIAAEAAYNHYPDLEYLHCGFVDAL
ncbi:hypothetical protein [Tateyamaria sp.]